MTAIAAAPEIPPLLRPAYLAAAGAALVAMTAAILSQSYYFLNLVHVAFGVMWTGADLLLGFVVGPIVRSLDLPARRAFAIRLAPRTVVLMPTLAIVTTTSGWYLAEMLGYTSLAWPEVWWLWAALAVSAVLTVQGLFVLLPTNVRIFLEVRRPEPSHDRLAELLRRYTTVVAIQGAMQVAILFIMARFATGI